MKVDPRRRTQTNPSRTGTMSSWFSRCFHVNSALTFGSNEKMPSDEWDETLAVAVDYLSGGGRSPPSGPSPPSCAMRLLGRDMEKRHYGRFRSLAQTFLRECGPDPCARLRGAMEELVGDGHLNWGRVVSLFAFTRVVVELLEEGGWERLDLGQEQQQQQQQQQQPPRLGPDFSRRLAATIADFLGEEKKQWLRDNGGWEGLCKYHSDRCHQSSSSVKTALFAAVAGVGLVGLTFLLR